MSGMLRKLVEHYGIDVEKTFNVYVSKCNYDGMGDKAFLKDGIDFICRRQEGDEYSEGAMLGFILGSAHCAENMKAICDGQNEGFTVEMTEAADNAIKSFTPYCRAVDATVRHAGTSFSTVDLKYGSSSRLESCGFLS